MRLTSTTNISIPVTHGAFRNLLYTYQRGYALHVLPRLRGEHVGAASTRHQRVCEHFS